MRVLLRFGLLLSVLPALLITITESSEPSTSAADSRTELAQVRQSLDGKVMVGYQGWFNCEGDGAGLGWTHWSRNRGHEFGPGNVTVDLWPDVSEYDADELFDTGFVFADGTQAQVFSSYSQKTVARHFEWMKDYGIDGAFLQRFANGLRAPNQKQHKDAVLNHVRTASRQAGRTYAVMYDLSGLPKGGCQRVQQDWKDLQDKRRVTRDESYQFHDGKPLVAVWGIGFLDGKKPREYSLAECKELIEFFRAQGCAVMLGVPTGWRTLDRDSVDDPELHKVLQLADIISPWTVGRYRDEAGVGRHAKRSWKPDIDWCKQRKLDYLPVVFPGFSWHNLKGDPLDSIPRNKGEFLWSQVVAAKAAGAQMLYVAMFDEVDEGTAIFKCSNHPPTGNGGSFLTNEGLPSDFYLKLVGRAGKFLRDEGKSDQ